MGKHETTVQAEAIGQTGPITAYGASYLLRDLGKHHGQLRMLEEMARTMAEMLEELHESLFCTSNMVLTDVVEGTSGTRVPERWPSGEEDDLTHDATPRKGRATSREAALSEDDRHRIKSERLARRGSAAK